MITPVDTNNNTTETGDLEQLFKTQTDNLLELQELKKKQLGDRKKNDLQNNATLYNEQPTKKKTLDVEINKRYTEALQNL